ncbi:MAG: hypothetical protein KIT09_17905 [Bryobacteraceae bacterium]|nr:hypothetical protein [Bryobacteraceae bacterium]
MATSISAGPDERVATALLVSPHRDDHFYFDALFSRTNWQLHHAYTSDDALAMLDAGLAPVIIVDEKLDGEAWDALLEAIRRSPASPKLLVTSLLGGPSSHSLDEGAYDILARPMVQAEVLHSISMAWLAWKCERYAGPSPLRPPQVTATPAAASATNTIE